MHMPPVITVAVIDDDRRVLTSLANLLASRGYRTQLYEGAEAFLSVDHSDLVCVITDLGMRPIDGLQALQRIVQSPSPVPAIIITGRPSENSDDYFLQRGAIGLSRKPVDGDAVLERLNDVIWLYTADVSPKHRGHDSGLRDGGDPTCGLSDLWRLRWQCFHTG